MTGRKGEKMAQQVSDENAKNDAGIQDDIGALTAQGQKEQFEKEIKLFEENLERLETARARMVEQWKVDEELMLLQLEGDNNTKVNPTYKFETLPKYNELILKKVQWRYEQEKHLEDKKTEKYELDKKNLNKQLESTRGALEKLVGGKDE